MTSASRRLITFFMLTPSLSVCWNAHIYWYIVIISQTKFKNN